MAAGHSTPGTDAALHASAMEPSAAQPLPHPPSFERLRITTHRELAAAVREVARRVASHPGYASMFAVNPVLALDSYGVELTPELRDHVLRTIKHPPAVKTRRDELEETLAKTLGERPRPDDPAWLARTLFGKLGVKPLRTEGASPIYEPPVNADLVARARTLGRPARQKYKPTHAGTVRASVGLAPWTEKAPFLDLHAKVPALPVAHAAPETLGIDEAWFYKDASETAHDLVELGSIMRTGLLFHLPDSYRQIAEGRKANVFRAWITSLRFEGGRR